MVTIGDDAVYGMRDAAEKLALEAFTAVRDGEGIIGADDFDSLSCLAGRANDPQLLADAWFGGRIELSTLVSNIGYIWTGAEYPNQCLNRATWRTLFSAAGYTKDGQPAERPSDRLELWRGSVPERRRDWSWSTDRAVAGRFARGVRGRPPGRIYRVLAPPAALLCEINDRQESEFVVDTRGLRITES
jgi:hypothetical protein